MKRIYLRTHNVTALSIFIFKTKKTKIRVDYFFDTLTENTTDYYKF